MKVGPGVAFALLALSPGVQAEPACEPTVSLLGDPELVEAVGAELTERGVPQGEGACGTRAELAREPGGDVHVSIVDADGRTSERRTTSPEAAATAIALWAGVDQTAPLLPLLETSTAPVHDVEEAPIEPRPDRPTRRVSLGASAEVGLSGDLATWRGARAAACVDIESICAGIDMRYATDTRRWGDSRDRSTHRRAIDVGLSALWAIDWGSFRAGPGIGVGMATIRSTRRTDEELLRGDAAVPQLRALAGIVVPMRRSWALRIEATYGWMIGAPDIFGDPDPDPDDPPPIAGAPTHHGWLSVGVAYEGL